MVRLLTVGYETGSLDEDGGTSLTNQSACTLASTGPTPRSGAYYMKANTTNSNNAYTCRRYNLGVKTEVYARIPFYAGLTTTSNPFAFCRIYDSAGTSHLYLTVTQTDAYIRLYLGTPFTGTLLATATRPYMATGWNSCEWRATIADVGGVFQLWLNGFLVIDYTGDTRNAGNADIQYVELGCWVSNYSNTNYLGFDDFAFNDTSGTQQNGRCNDASVLYLPPNGNGTTTQLDGSDGDATNNYALVSDVPPSSTQYVYSHTTDEYDTYAVTDLSTSYDTVVLVQPIAWAAMAAGGTGAVNLMIKSGATESSDAADSPLTTSYYPIRGDIRYNNPDGDIAWTPTTVNAVEIGAKVR